MQLVYRGSTYTAMSEMECVDSAVMGKYRGCPMTLRMPQPTVGVAQPQAIAKLTYRGADYLRVRY